MEGSKGEMAFDAHGLNPQLFVNEILNSVDDVIDGAFEFCLRQALAIASGGAQEGDERSDEAEKGVSYLKNVTQSVVDKRLGFWEKYCLQHCFSVPEGFVLPATSVHPSTPAIDVAGGGGSGNEADVDARLSLLRQKLAAVGKETVELQRELQFLEAKTASNNSVAAIITEALQLYEQNNAYEVFQELGEAASHLRSKVAALKERKREGLNHQMFSKQQYPFSKGLSCSIGDLQRVVDILRKV